MALPDLVPSTPYALAYTLPLLVISVLLLFAGSFLSLDRTRSFAPAPPYSTLPGTYEPKRLPWLLEGGVGGLALGYAFGAHLSTLLALLIPATTASAALSPKSFLAVWILSCIPTTVLAGRFRPVALLFAGIIGGITFSLALSIILHPSLLPRQILLGVFSCLFTTFLSLSNFIPRLSPFLRPLLRTASASLGAFGLVVAIALLTHPPVLGWANVWERLWLKNGRPGEWGTNKEQGLSAAWAIFFVFGILGDWSLHRWVGECPDEKWDNYLSKYVSDPPNFADRAGTFRPLLSFWDRLFGRRGSGALDEDGKFFLGPAMKGGEKDHIIFPDDKELQRVPLPALQIVDAYYSLPPPKPASAAFKLHSNTHRSPEISVLDLPNGATFLRKKKTVDKKTKLADRKKKPLKFGSMGEISSSDISDDEDTAKANGVNQALGNRKPQRPWVIMNQHSSYSSSDVSTAPTLVDGKRSAPQTPVAPPALPTVAKTRDREPREAVVVDIDYDKELEQLQAQLGSRSRRDERKVNAHSDDEDRRQAQSTWAPAFLHRQPPAHRQNDFEDRDVHDLDWEGNSKDRVGERTPPPRWDDFWKEVRVKAGGL